MIKKAWAVWKGGIKDGGGSISTETGVLKDRLMASRRDSRMARAPTPRS